MVWTSLSASVRQYREADLRRVAEAKHGRAAFYARRRALEQRWEAELWEAAAAGGWLQSVAVREEEAWAERVEALEVARSQAAVGARAVLGALVEGVWRRAAVGRAARRLAVQAVQDRVRRGQQARARWREQEQRWVQTGVLEEERDGGEGQQQQVRAAS